MVVLYKYIIQSSIFFHCRTHQQISIKSQLRISTCIKHVTTVPSKILDTFLILVNSPVFCIILDVSTGIEPGTLKWVHHHGTTGPTTSPVKHATDQSVSWSLRGCRLGLDTIHGEVLGMPVFTASWRTTMSSTHSSTVMYSNQSSTTTGSVLVGNDSGLLHGRRAACFKRTPGICRRRFLQRHTSLQCACLCFAFGASTLSVGRQEVHLVC